MKPETKRALISVTDKTGIVEFAHELTTLGYEIISTGGKISSQIRDAEQAFPGFGLFIIPGLVFFLLGDFFIWSRADQFAIAGPVRAHDDAQGDDQENPDNLGHLHQDFAFALQDGRRLGVIKCPQFDRTTGWSGVFKKDVGNVS